MPVGRPNDNPEKKESRKQVMSELAELQASLEAEKMRCQELSQELTRLKSEQLPDSEQWLKKAQEIAHLGSWELDLITNKLSWSDEIYRIFGLEPGQFGATYEAFLDVVHPDDRKAVDAAYTGSIREGRDVYEIEHRVVRNSTGEIRHVHEKCEHIRNASGKVIRSVGMVHDITKYKLAEEALHQAKYDLEITVKERTAELQQINARLREENQERVWTEQLLRLEQSRLDALLHLSRIGEAPLQEIAEFTLGQAIALSHSKIGFLGFMNEDESIYTLHAVSKNVVKECNVTGDPLQWHVIDAGIWADAIREHKTLFVNDYSKPHPSKKGLPPGHLHVERFMVVPIVESEKVVAVAGVGNKASEYDKSDERQIVLLLSGMCGYLQNERSRQDLQKAYNELEERTRELAAKNMELKKSQYLLEKTFASLDEVVLVVDLADPSTRRIVTANPAVKRVLGYSEEELIGRSIEMLHVNKAMFERFGSELAAALDAKGVCRCEFQMRRKDGSIILTEHTVSEVLDESEKRTGVVHSLRDISERKAAEEQLLAYQDQLRNLSSELVLSEERERRRLAEDLHDSVAQLLAFSKYRLEDALAKSFSEGRKIEIEEVCRYLDQALEQTRSLMFELSPPALYMLGLKPALVALAEKMESSYKLRVEFTCDKISQDLSQDCSVFLFRAIRELLLNIAKHAGVSQARLSLAKEDNRMRVEVEDQGVGFDLPVIPDHTKPGAGGFGLFNVQERVRHIGGRFEITSRPGKGTRITLIVPLAAQKKPTQRYRPTVKSA